MPAAAEVAALEGLLAERRVCSVLFCDLVGFTPLSESRDPEAVRELLSEYFAVARTVVGRYGGVVEKFIGDAVMAVWGTPKAAEGDAERAVRAGLDLVAAVAALGATGGVAGLAARAGIVTGEVAVTLGASGEGMVAGDVVNTAARVQVTAGPGQVLVDGATQRLAGSAVGFADAGERALKGKAEPARLWQATRVLAGIGGSQRIDGLEAPLTGRDAELRAIRDLFHATAERKVPRLVLVSGPAGVGKSRLGWEFWKYLDGLADTVWWHRGRCLAYGDGVAFWALAEIVRQRLGIAEDDPAGTATGKLAGGLDTLVPDPGERAYIAARLGRLLGVTADGDDGAPLAREELFAGWRLFFGRLAAQRPVVLLVEDAQYADAGLLDFLGQLIDWSRDLPVYLLVLARPELVQARPGFGAGPGRITLTLDPLDAASMDKLLDGLVTGMPAPARSRVVSHAQGIPLFAVEIVRALIDQDIVQPRGGVYRLVGDIGELAVPDSLHALLAARLDALDPGVRRLVADAAVLGTTFSAEALIAVCGQDEPAVRAGLAELVRREVLSVSADRLSPERGSYRFTQNMLRQVAYDTQSRRDRKARHLKVAAHLRAAFPGEGEEVADVIARHYLDALQAVPGDTDTGQIRNQAIGALIRAAERAERTGAPALAAISYAQAADLTQAAAADAGEGADRQPDAGKLWERAAEAAMKNADWAGAVNLADRARDYHLERGQGRAAARAQAIAGEALRLWGHHSQARDRLTAAVEILRPEPDPDTVRALQHLADLETFDGSPDKADRLTTEALVLGQDLGVGPDQLGDLLLSRGIGLSFVNRQAEAVAYLRESARIASQAGDNLRLGRVLLNLGSIISYPGILTDRAAGLDAARTAADHLRRAGARDYLAYAIANTAELLLEDGDWDGAEEELTRAVESDGLADIDIIAFNHVHLAALRGDAATAESVLAALPDMRASENPGEQGHISELEAFTAAARNQPEAALRHARAALAHYADASLIPGIWSWSLAARAAHDLGDIQTIRDLFALLDSSRPGQFDPRLRAERDLARARLASRDGDQAAAASFVAAVSSLREAATPYHLAHGLLDHADYLTRLGDTETAEAAISEARDIAQRLRCQPLLDRAETIQTAKPATKDQQLRPLRESRSRQAVPQTALTPVGLGGIRAPWGTSSHIRQTVVGTAEDAVLRASKGAELNGLLQRISAMCAVIYRQIRVVGRLPALVMG